MVIDLRDIDFRTFDRRIRFEAAGDGFTGEAADGRGHPGFLSDSHDGAHCAADTPKGKTRRMLSDGPDPDETHVYQKISYTVSTTCPE
jgi:hypothetical protein